VRNDYCGYATCLPENLNGTHRTACSSHPRIFFFLCFGILPYKFDGEVNLRFVEWCRGNFEVGNWDYEKFGKVVWLVRNDCCGDYFKPRHGTTFAFFPDRNLPALDVSPCNVEGKESLRCCGEFSVAPGVEILDSA
jgi:hypothetical protein